MNLGTKKTFMWVVVAVITLLLAVQLIFSYRNSAIIEENLIIRRQAQQVKVNTLDIIRTLHQLDIGLRGFALVPDQQIAAPFDSAHLRIKMVFETLEQELSAQNFNMNMLTAMRDSVDSYFAIADIMFQDLKENKREEFLNYWLPIMVMARGFNTQNFLPR